MRVPCPTAALLALLAGTTLAAQTVSGSLTDPTSAGVRGATVLLVDASGREAASAVTGAAGDFTLRAGYGGRFTLRAERIGYTTTVSPPFDLAVGDTLRRDLVANARRVLLDAVVVTGRQRCEVRPGTGARTAEVWAEARKALTGTRASAGSRAYLFSLRRYRRSLDPRTEQVLREEVRPQEEWSGEPFFAVDPAVLVAQGFVRTEGDTTTFSAPDARVLLSDVFLDGHCFRLQEPPRDHPRWIGLSFEPVSSRRRVTDVRGVLWVDRATAELRSLEYRFTGLPGGARTEHLSRGTIGFARLPDGSWIIRRWQLRMPQVVMDPAFRTPLSPEGSPVVASLVEEGGDVTSVTTRGGQPVPLGTPP
jgi:hypothetical protein